MNELDLGVELDFPAVRPKSTLNKHNAEIRPIMTVKVIYENGDVESWMIPKDQGFVRKRYTFLQGNEKGDFLLCYDIHWALKGTNV
jgi:hypothetical protein